VDKASSQQAGKKAPVQALQSAGGPAAALSTKEIVLVQREMDKRLSRLTLSLAFGKEVF
jgi:hypothetical protein